MERTKYQKALLVISIINIVFGVFGLIAGLLAGVVSSFAASATNTGLTGDEQAIGAAAIGIIAAIAVISSLVGLAEGILGIRAARDSQKIMPLWVLSFVGVGLGVIQVVTSISSDGFQITTLLPLVFPGLVFWLANSIKMEAGR